MNEVFSDQWFVMFVWAAVSGMLSLLIAERSRIDAWAEKNPRIAGVLKLLRALGFDPWLIVSAVSLIVRKKLPAVQARQGVVKETEGGVERK